MRSVLSLASVAAAWYLPGMAPTDYDEGDVVPVLVNRLAGAGRGDNNAVLGVDYYSTHLRFCEPAGGKKSNGGSLGAILFGDRIFTSPMELHMLQDVPCQYICTSEYTPGDADTVVSLVLRDMEQHWLVDGLPVWGRDSDDNLISSNSFPLGEMLPLQDDRNPEARLYNHYDFVVSYHHNAAADKYRVVGVSVQPSSRQTKTSEKPNTSSGEGRAAPSGFKCAAEPAGYSADLQLDSSEPRSVSFSYSVRWEASETVWATRWDQYLQVSNPRINWFALANTTVVVCVLGTLVSAALTRMLRRDIARYNHVDLDTDELPDEIGWKLVAGDVFRAPEHLQTYAVAMGVGAQTLATLLATLLVAALGFLSPANRGSFSTALLLLNTLLGGVGGYVSAVTYKTWGGTRWKTNLVLTPLVLPAVVFALFMCLNLLLVLHDASGAVPLGSIVAVVLIWGAVAVPLSVIHGLLAFKRAVPLPPNMRVNQIARQIPPQPWYHRTLPMMAVGGLVPMMAVALQVRYILRAVWFQRIYYMFGFLFASTWAMIVLSALSALLALYYTLVNENYRWQWRTFFVAGSPAVYVFLDSCYYLTFHMAVGAFMGRLLFVMYSMLFSTLLFLALGSVGSATSYVLVRRIYESIKVD